MAAGVSAPAAAAVASGAVTARGIAQAAVDAIARRDGELRAFTAVDASGLLAAADRLDDALARGEPPGPLAGVTVGVKDLVDVAGLPTSWGTDALPAPLATRDARVVTRLRAAGALIVGKTRTAELAWSTLTPPTVNPTDPALVAGGSSGGSAAAVGAGLVAGGIGTDTACSVRLPAALCGVVGVKPTYGAVGRSGVLVCSPSLDHVGPLARTVADARALLAALVAPDPGDAGSAPGTVLDALAQRLAAPPRPVAGARLGVLDDELVEVVEPRARRSWAAALERLGGGGFDLVTVALPECRYVPGALLAIDLPESAAVHSDALRAGADISPAIAGLLRVSHAIPAVLTARAHAARAWIVRRVAELFGQQRLDALITPATVAGAIPAADPDRAFRRADGTTEPAAWGYPRPFWLASLTGQPAVTVPSVRTSPPLGVQLVGRPFADDALLDVAAAVERCLAGLEAPGP